MYKKYRTSELFHYFGVSRDTLRFYEEKGLLNPQKNAENKYRGYDIFDVYTLIKIDFYKKRGMSIQQIQDLLKLESIQDLQDRLQDKKRELESLLYETRCMLQRIEETQEFSRNLARHTNTFSMKPLPLYRVNGEVSDFIAVEEYGSVKEIMCAQNEDMFSQIMRYITFNKTSVTGTKMLIVSPEQQPEEGGDYLFYPKCLYTVAEEFHPQEDQEDLMETMYRTSLEYANNNGLSLLGEAFAKVRLFTNENKRMKTYIEIFIPYH